MNIKELSSHPSSQWSGKSVLITGVCGTIGSSILATLVNYNTKYIVGVDNNECAMYLLQNEYAGHSGIRFRLGDVRDIRFLISVVEDIDVVIHAAALKHVAICEKSPESAISTNIGGVQNIIEAAKAANVDRVIFTSSDKAVNPTNVMGASKLIGERLITAASINQIGKRTIFASTRFGNVIGSRGSVVPLFHKQISRGGPVTLTHPEMTRFFMTLKQAVRLVLESVFVAKGGEILVTKMPVMEIGCLAKAMIAKLSGRYGYHPKNIEVKIIGAGLGEKLHEELVSEEEIRRSIELDRYYVILPTVEDKAKMTERSYNDTRSLVPGELYYSSSTVKSISLEHLEDFLVTNDVLSEDHTSLERASM